MGGLFNAADAGRADIVTKNLTNVRDAERAQGVDTSEVDGLLADLNSGDAAKVKSAVTMTKGFAQMHLAAINPDKFNETYGVLGKGDAPDEKNHFSTAGDGTIYDQRTGAVVRQGSPKAEYRTVRNADGSESIIQVGGGGQASGSGGGAPNSTSGSPRYTGGWTPRARNGGDNSDAAVDSKIAGAAQYLGVDPGADISKLSPMKIAQAMTLSEGGAGSLADRNNNPGNMRNGDGTYKKFPTKEAGLAAASALVARKLRNGQTTVQSLIEGIPAGGAPRSQGGQVVYTSQGTDSGTDGIVAGDIATVPAQIRSAVQAVAEGRAAAPRAGSRNGQAILDAVTAYDPTFDAANATSRVKTRVDFTSGKSAQAVNALNTAMGHLLHLDDQAHDLGNFSTAPGILNPLYNVIREKVGNNTALPAFDQTKQAAASEMRKVFAGAGGGSEAELKAWESQLSSSKSFEQLHEVIKNGVTLMGSRLSALQGPIRDGHGAQRPDSTDDQAVDRARRQESVRCRSRGGGCAGQGCHTSRCRALAIWNAVRHARWPHPEEALMLGGDDPWLAVGSPVDVHDQHHAPARLPAQGPGNVQAPQARPQVQADPYAPLADPAQPQGDQSTTVGDQMEGGFADSHPDTPKSTMSPEDEAHYTELLHTGSASDITRFLASKSYSTDQDWLAKFIYARDNRRKNGGKVNYGISYRFPTPEEMTPEQRGEDPKLGGAAPGVNAGVRGALGTIPGFDKLAALSKPVDEAARRALGIRGQGTRGFWDEYNHEYDLHKGLERGDESNHPWVRVGGQLLGGLAIPAGLEGIGLKAGTDVLQAGGTMAEARAAVKIAVRNRMAATGGAYGAAHGALGAETPGDAVTGALTEGGLGAVTGGTMGQVAPEGRAAIDRIAAPLTEAQQVAQAADRQGIDPFALDVGGSATRRIGSAIAQTPFGAGPVIAAARRVGAQAQDARDRIAAAVGQALQPEAAGQQARMGATNYIQNSRNAARGLYTAAERAAGGQQVQPTEALAALDRNIAELSQTPGGAPGLARLQGLRDELARGTVSVAGLRNMRTVLRDQFITDGLRGSDLERRVGQVLDAASNDVTNGLRASGNGQAAQLYTQADAAWRNRADTIDNVIKPLIGTRERPLSGEQVIKTLTADLQGNNARAVRFLRALPPEEQANTRASIIGALGRQSAGAQNAEGDGFSLAQFLTHWSRIGETAKRAYFGDEARSALNDLARVAQGSKEAAAFANKSNTGGVSAALMTGVTAIPSLGATVVSQYGLGRLLASPRFARWLARAPRTALSTPAYVDRLSRIARAEPAIANEVLQLQQRLASAFTGSSMPTRLAAQEPANEPDGGQGNAGEQQPENQSLQP
jgi:hypothetical protein